MLLRLNGEVNNKEGGQRRSERTKKSSATRVISRLAQAITKSHLNANKLDGQNETGLKRLNHQIIPVIKQEKGHTGVTPNKEAHTQNISYDYGCPEFF